MEGSLFGKGFFEVGGAMKEIHVSDQNHIAFALCAFAF